MAINRKGQPSGLTFLLWTLLLLGTPATAQARSPDQPTLREFAPQFTAGEIPKRWYDINYYRETRRGFFTSEISNAAYFVSEAGQQNPTLEWEAFQELVWRHEQTGEGAQVLCRYPARLTLLSEFSGRAFRRPDCPEIERQFQPSQVQSVSFVFASGYFNNPGSYYGHTLLKFNLVPGAGQTEGLEAAINYGAATTDSPGNPMYAINGLFGGYTATYTRNDYFLHSYQYTSAQLRDTWEYELNLSPASQRFIVEHSWEMQHAEFPYYFFNDNCAHRIAALIEMATGRNLSSTHGFWLLPIQVVRSLDGLIKRETFNPSLLTEFNIHRDSLNDNQKRALRTYVRSTPEVQANLVGQSDTAMLNITLDYLDLQVALNALEEADSETSTGLQRKRAIVLKELFARPTGQSTRLDETSTSELSPRKARAPSKFRIGTRVTEGEFSRLLQYRVANNDFLESRAYGQGISRFLMGDIELRERDGNVAIERATLVEIWNLNTKSAEFSDTSRSWSLAVDYARRDQFCDDCKDFGITWKVGRARMMNENFLLYGLTGPRLHTRSGPEDEFATMRGEIGAVADVTNRWKVNAYIRGHWGATSNESGALWGMEAAFNANRHFDLRLSARTMAGKEQYDVSLAYYFD